MPSRDGGRVARDGSCVKCNWNAANPKNKSQCQKGHASDCPENGVYKRQLAKKKEGNNRLTTTEGGGGGRRGGRAKQSQQQQEAILQAAAAEGAKIECY